MHTFMQLTTQLQSPAGHPIYLRACQNINSQKVHTCPLSDQAQEAFDSPGKPYYHPRPPPSISLAVSCPMMDEKRLDLTANVMLSHR